MVKTRRSNGENGEVDERNDASNEVPNDAASVSEEKESNWTPRELRSSRYNRPQLPRWPANYKRRLRKIKMKRIVFPESDTDPEKYSRRSRQVRVFFTGDDDSTNRSVKIRRNRTPRKNYVEETVDSEDKPIQQNVRRSCRQRKLLHHNFNESWITNELKVRGYPGLYGIPGTSSSDEFTSGDDAPVRDRKKVSTRPPAVTDDDTQSGRQRRTSMRFNNSNKKGTESDSDVNNDQTVIEQLPGAQLKEEAMDAQGDEGEREGGRLDDAPAQDADSAPAPARATRGRGRLGKARQKKDEFSHQETASESESSESGSGLMRCGPPRRSKRTRKPTTFVEIAPRETRTRTQTFTIRKKPYSLRERKPKILRRKNIRSQSPDSSSSSGSSSDSDEDLNVSMKNKTKGRQKSRSMDDKKTDRALRDIRPIEVDGSVRFTSVGGLDEHIKCLREMVLFPLMYPEVFQKFGSRPAKGVLFHGPPGTGKTLLARALANECSVVGGRKVAFFLRKGADCLKKWVGESERHLKLLFQQANKMKPSIIFFDEVDALAPVRSARQEQVHASVVGTLLAEMDGLCDRGEVVVIGATNRLDGIDPALRRAGRFDRELYFPAPAARARRDILHICTRGWQRPPPPRALDALAAETHGYGGSDLKALCSEAVLKALRRVYPQVYESEHALLIDPNNVEVTEADFLSAMRTMVAASSRAAPPPARALPAHAAPLLHAQLQAARELLQRGVCSSSDAASPATFLLAGPCAGSHLAPALLADMEHAAVRELSLAELHAPRAPSAEAAVISVFSECRRAEAPGGSVIAVRDIDALGAVAALLRSLWLAGAAGPRALLLATSTVPHHELSSDLQALFPLYKQCVYAVREPTASEVVAFLRPPLTEAPLRPPPAAAAPPPPLPRAPPPPPPRESKDEASRRKRKEDYKLRELRIFLRDICRKLASNRRFYKFTKPVDLEEVTDYPEIIKKPMDLETMMTKVDLHQYNCAREFLDDVDLICANALEYNPDRTSSDKQIRHEACSLRDHAHALIDVEMDSDFELECQQLAARRAARAERDDDLPDFIYTAANISVAASCSAAGDAAGAGAGSAGGAAGAGAGGAELAVKRKRRRMNAWSKGLVAKRQRTSHSKSFTNKEPTITDEESKENQPITSTPLPNGDAHSSHDSGSDDDDAPLRPRPDERSGERGGDVRVLGSPAKPTDKAVSRSSPKKRNSGHDSSAGDTVTVQINQSELENLLYKNVKALRTIGLAALLDLHAQLSAALQRYAGASDRARLPHDYQELITRYVQQLAKK